jgi:hypothetical protein
MPTYNRAHIFKRALEKRDRSTMRNPGTMPALWMLIILIAIAAIGGGIYFYVVRGPEKPAEKPPGQARLNSPTDGALMNNSIPTFEWICGLNAENHRLLVDDDPNFSSPELDVLLAAADNAYTPTTPLADENYFWKVIAISAVGENSSEVWTFLIDTTPPAQPSLVWPANGESLNDPTPNLDWGAVPENALPVTYFVWIDNDPDFSSPEISAEVTTDNYQLLTALAEGMWYWCVCARDGVGNVGDNSLRWFKVDVSPPTAPILVWPTQGENTTDNTPTLDWGDVSDPSAPITYDMQVDDNPDFSSPLVNITNLTSSSYTTQELPEGTWHWRVRARDNAGNVGSWSSSSFNVVGVPPPLPASSLTISVEPLLVAGQTASITVRAYDVENKPVSGASISLFALAMEGEFGSDYEVELTLTDEGNGVYTSSLTSSWAGVYSLTALVDGTDIQASGQVEFIAGAPAEVIASFTRPRPSSSYRSGATFYFADAYGNSLPPDNVQPIVSVSQGKIENLENNPNGSFNFDLVFDNWGVVTVSITENLGKISENFNVSFPPIYTEVEQDLSPISLELIPPENENGEIRATWSDNKLSLKIGIFFPGLNELGAYGMILEYDNSFLRPLHVMDGDPTDNLPEPMWENFENFLILWQSGSAPPGGIDVAIVDFEPLKTGTTEVTIENLELYKIIDENILVPVEVPVPFLEHITVLKPLKRLIVPVKKWIVEGSGVTEEDVRNEFKKVEETYHKAAKECKLDYWVIFIVEINHISKAKWDNYVGADGKLNPTERGEMLEGDSWYPDRWVNIYNVPPCSLVSSSGKSIIGVWRRTGGIWSDKSKDKHDRNIAHELMHEFSKSEVKDSPEDNAAAQGAREPNNIMRYCGGGKEISTEQGKILNDGLDERAKLYDADGDGKPEGYIYKP